jgi:predicted transcriptional regulator
MSTAFSSLTGGEREEAEARVMRGVPVMNGRRTKFDIIADILRLEGARTREIMDTANLSYVQLLRYLSSLTEADFIVHSPGRNGLAPYRVTSKGRELLRHIEVVLEMLSPPPNLEAPKRPLGRVFMGPKNPQKRQPSFSYSVHKVRRTDSHSCSMEE